MKVSIISLSLAAMAIGSPILNLGAATGLFKPKQVGRGLKSPFRFTSSYAIVATPDQVVNASNVATGGLPGASGLYLFGINSHDNVICYNITLDGFRGNYSSPAATATHIHEAPKGMAGPPRWVSFSSSFPVKLPSLLTDHGDDRLAFPNPVLTGEGDKRSSVGCLTGPFTTGALANGTDTGAGFHVRQIEEDPAAFFADVHSSLAVAGAVRGQLDQEVCREKKGY
ncbi:hypothetical protein RB601_005627 [Gaeumannomyces tritici]